jgi:hypothetical protein
MGISRSFWDWVGIVVNFLRNPTHSPIQPISPNFLSLKKSFNHAKYYAIHPPAFRADVHGMQGQE